MNKNTIYGLIAGIVIALGVGAYWMMSQDISDKGGAPFKTQSVNACENLCTWESDIIDRDITMGENDSMYTINYTCSYTSSCGDSIWESELKKVHLELKNGFNFDPNEFKLSQLYKGSFIKIISLYKYENGSEEKIDIELDMCLYEGNMSSFLDCINKNIVTSLTQFGGIEGIHYNLNVSPTGLPGGFFIQFDIINNPSGIWFGLKGDNELILYLINRNGTSQIGNIFTSNTINNYFTAGQNFIGCEYTTQCGSVGSYGDFNNVIDYLNTNYRTIKLNDKNNILFRSPGSLPAKFDSSLECCFDKEPGETCGGTYGGCINGACEGFKEGFCTGYEGCERIKTFNICIRDSCTRHDEKQGTCELLPFCGDDKVNQDIEQCDGTSTNTCPIPGSTCSPKCHCTPPKSEPVCGNGILEEGEQCDGKGQAQCGAGSTCLMNGKSPCTCQQQQEPEEPKTGGDDVFRSGDEDEVQEQVNQEIQVMPRALTR